MFNNSSRSVPSPHRPTTSTGTKIAATSSLSDKDLYHLCQLYGGNAKQWLRKFAGLLPEVYKRSLHLQRGCGSITEFAKKLSGMNERTVKKILNLHERLIDKPHLLALFESGEQGWSKLEAVAFIATLENEKDLAEKVKKLPQKSLFMWVKNFREKYSNAIKNLTVDGQFRLHNNSQDLQNAIWGNATEYDQNTAIASATPNDLSAANTKSTTLPHHPESFTNFSFPVSTHSRQKLNFIKSALEKQHKKTLTWNQVIELWPTMASPTTIIKICPSCAHKKIAANALRHIPFAIRRLVLAMHGYICVFPNCKNAYAEFHHLIPYSICKTHDPSNIFPLCKTHHTLFHAGLIENAEKSPQYWSIRTHAQQTKIDKKAMKFKMNKSTGPISSMPLYP